MKNVDYNNILRLLILLGFPIVALAASLVNLSDSQVITISFRAVVLGLSIYCLFRTKKGSFFLNCDALMIFFFICYALRLIIDWKILNIDNTDKAITFFLFIVAMPVVASCAVGLRPQDDEKLAKLCALSGVIFCIIVIIARTIGLGLNRYEQYNVQSTRLEFSVLNPISLGYSGYVACIAAITVASRCSSRFKKQIWTIASIAGLLVVVFANSRSPILALGAGILLIYGKKIQQWTSLGLIIMVFLFLVNSFFTNELSNISDRFYKEGSFAQDGAREYLREVALDAFLRNPIFGAYHVDPNLGEGLYPHNIFYDTAMSLGLIGLIPLCILIYKSFINFIMFYHRDYPFMSVILIGLFLQANTSGTIWAYDGFFMLLSLSLAAKKSVVDKN